MDSNLEFLNECSNEQLKTLVDILVFDKDGKKRVTESLSSTKAFAECYPNNLKPLIPEIINEFQLYGGNSIMNKLRGHGVEYREILEDVCNRLKVNFNKSTPTELLEGELLKKVAISVVDEMTDEQIKDFDANLDKEQLQKAIYIGGVGGPVVMAIAAVAISQFGVQVGKKGALMVFGRLLAPRVAAFTVPVLNIAAAVSTLFDVASPAFRVTIPFTITLAFLRRQIEAEDDDLTLSQLFA